MRVMSRRTMTAAFALAFVACRSEPVAEPTSDAATDGPEEVGPFELSDGWAPLREAAAGPTPPDAIAPPIITCAEDGGADVCPIPASLCANGAWLEYFESRGCQGTTCSYEPKLLHCYSGRCSDGGCVIPQFTSPVPP